MCKGNDLEVSKEADIRGQSSGEEKAEDIKGNNMAIGGAGADDTKLTRFMISCNSCFC